MSTLATTNIKNPSSGTNNIELETNGDVTATGDVAVGGNLKKLDASAHTLTSLGILGGIVSVNQALNQTRSTITGTSGGFTDVTGLSVTVTPSSTNSKFLIFARVFGEGGVEDGHNWSMAIFRNSINVNAGDAGVTAQRVICTAGSDYWNNNADSTPQTWNATTLDSPNTTSSITYKITMTAQGSTGTFYLNGTVNSSTTNAAYERGSSELIVMEINV
jgi:hypothetical protein